MKAFTFFLNSRPSPFHRGGFRWGFFALLLTISLSSTAQIFESATVSNHTFVASSFINDNEGWLADDSAMLWHTKDTGQTWNSISVEKNFLTLDFADALNGYAVAADGLHKTTDGGYTWSLLSLPGYTGNSIYFLDSITGFIGGYQMIFKTTDGGLTWSTIYTGDVSFINFCFTSTSVGIAVAYDDEDHKCIWRTTDGGLTWKNTFNERNYFMKSVCFINENSGWAAGYYDEAGLGKEPAILHTTDGGLTWKSVYRYTEIVGSGETLTDIRFRNEQEGFAISHFSYDVYTIDGGATWNLTHDTNALGLSPLYGVYKTLDGYNDIYLAGQWGNVAAWK